MPETTPQQLEVRTVNRAATELGTLVDEDEFLDIIRARHGELLAAARFTAEQDPARSTLTRPVLARILSETEQLEEFLDAYGANHNSRWLALREITAAARIYSRIAYTVLHIRHAHPQYHLLPIERDLDADSQKALAYLRTVLSQVMRQFMQQANSLGLEARREIYPDEYYEEKLPAGKLPADRRTRYVEQAKRTVLLVASECLQLAAEAAHLKMLDTARDGGDAALVPEVISEESLRQLEYRFHNLQSLYDTYLLGTDTEGADATLASLRGHVSIIFHLLQAGTLAVHFYERHVLMSPSGFSVAQCCGINTDRLLDFILGYTVGYAGEYVEGARSLCRSVLKRYAEIATIELPVPQYRGFHVRPATLIAKIVRHYGSPVQMQLKEQTYDASSTLDLFRANEAINAEKRRHIAEKIAELPEDVVRGTSADTPEQVVRRTVLALAERREVVIYEQPLPVENRAIRLDTDISDFVVDEVRRLLALGKIDIETHLAAKFTGDQRVLADIRRLADCGYGEDRFGNNVPLPPELCYLKRDTEPVSDGSPSA